MQQCLNQRAIKLETETQISQMMLPLLAQKLLPLRL